jgi:hypothetical protein
VETFVSRTKKKGTKFIFKYLYIILVYTLYIYIILVSFLVAGESTDGSVLGGNGGGRGCE